METSQLIFTANQLAGLYMRATLALNGLTTELLLLFFYFFLWFLMPSEGCSEQIQPSEVFYIKKMFL